MCRPKPFLRCSAHARQSLNKAKQAKLDLLSAPTISPAEVEKATRAVEQAQAEYDITPHGIEVLRRRGDPRAEVMAAKRDALNRAAEVYLAKQTQAGKYVPYQADEEEFYLARLIAYEEEDMTLASYIINLDTFTAEEQQDAELLKRDLLERRQTAELTNPEQLDHLYRLSFERDTIQREALYARLRDNRHTSPETFESLVATSNSHRRDVSSLTLALVADRAPLHTTRMMDLTDRLRTQLHAEGDALSEGSNTQMVETVLRRNGYRSSHLA